MPIIAIAVMLAGIAGASMVYAGVSHQRLLDKSGPRPLLRRIGWALLVLIFVLLLRWFDLPAAIFTWVALIMLTWSTLPLAAAWWRYRQDGKA